MREANLNELATLTRIPRAVLLREAVDDCRRNIASYGLVRSITACHRAALTG